VDPQGGKIGSIGQVYVDDETGVADWVTVNTGLFGTKEHFAPLYGSSISGDQVVLPFDKDVVKGAPDVADSSHLDTGEQQGLYSYYERYLRGGGGDAAYGRGADTANLRGAGHDTSGPNTDDAMTRSEERLNVGTQQVEAGRARLRKYVVTEQQTVNVPVSHEEVRVDREPIIDANRGQAMTGGEITEEEHEVILHAEQPVVATEAVPVDGSGWAPKRSPNNAMSPARSARSRSRFRTKPTRPPARRTANPVGGCRLPRRWSYSRCPCSFVNVEEARNGDG